MCPRGNSQNKPFWKEFGEANLNFRVLGLECIKELSYIEKKFSFAYEHFLQYFPFWPFSGKLFIIVKLMKYMKYSYLGQTIFFLGSGKDCIPFSVAKFCAVRRKYFDTQKKSDACLLDQFDYDVRTHDNFSLLVSNVFTFSGRRSMISLNDVAFFFISSIPIW